MVNRGAVPTVRAPVPVPPAFATTVHAPRARRIPPRFAHLFVVPPIPRGFRRWIGRPPRRLAAAAPADLDRVRRQISLKQLYDSQHWGEYQTTLRIPHADCRCTFP